MRRDAFASVVATIVLCLSAAPAAYAQHTLAHVLRSGNRLVRFTVVEGRVLLARERLANIDTNTSTPQLKETFRLCDENGRPRLDYQRQAGEEVLLVQVGGDGDQVRLKSVQRNKDQLLVETEYNQQPGQDVSLILIKEGARVELYAPDLWRLLFTSRAQCEEHLVPLLEMLMPQWKSGEMLSAIETILLQFSTEEYAARCARWTELVAQLGHDKYAVRQAADRALRAEGVAAIGFLRQLDFNRLDAEQRFRVRRILEAFAQRSDIDPPEEIAATLVNDPLVWLAFLESPELSVRQTAFRRLTELLGEVPPVAPTADPETQKPARDALRKKILKP